MEINRKSVLSVAVVLLVVLSGCLGGQSTTETEPKQNQSSDGVQNDKSRTVRNDSAKLNRSGTWREGSKFASLRTVGGLVVYKENSSNHKLEIKFGNDGYEVSGTWYMNLSSSENASVKKERVKRYAHGVCQ
ncbi:MAG: hypothetical protein SV760_05455, partial [Halobacteria archaeon]|nr:hypothetical protein [Halobacteria archaeon]